MKHTLQKISLQKAFFALVVIVFVLGTIFPIVLHAQGRPDDGNTPSPFPQSSGRPDDGFTPTKSSSDDSPFGPDNQNVQNAGGSQVGPPDDFKGLVDILLGISNLFVPVIFALTLLVILWGLSRSWILGAGDEEHIQKGKSIALVGVIVLVLMVGIWGILALLRSSFFGII